MLPIFFTTYGTVFVAEVVGDKLLYTTGVLATRYRSIAVALGMAIAFMCKMAVAVAIGEALSQLPRALVATLTAASFIGVALVVWRKPDERKAKARDEKVIKGAAVAFAAVFFSEWGDVGQVTAAAMAAPLCPTCRQGARRCSWRTVCQTNIATMKSSRKTRASVMKMTGMASGEPHPRIGERVRNVGQN